MKTSPGPETVDHSDGQSRCPLPLSHPPIRMGHPIVVMVRFRPKTTNGDIVVDDEDHAGDYTIMPIIVRLRWQGRHGARELRMPSVLSEFR